MADYMKSPSESREIQCSLVPRSFSVSSVYFADTNAHISYLHFSEANYDVASDPLFVDIYFTTFLSLKIF